MAKVIAICNHKGGVAKTTTTMNLGIGLAREEKSVLLIDADSQGNLTSALGWRNGDDRLDTTIASFISESIKGNDYDVTKGILNHEEGVDLLPANCELAEWEVMLVTAMNRERVLRNIISQVKERYDYILIDSPPSLGMMTINALAAADSVIIPVEADGFSLNGTKQLMRTINKTRQHINNELKVEGILVTRADFRTTFPGETKATLDEAFKKYINVFDVMIPEAVSTKRAVNQGKSIFEYDNKNPVAKAYGELTKALIKNKERNFDGIVR